MYLSKQVASLSRPTHHNIAPLAPVIAPPAPVPCPSFSGLPPLHLPPPPAEHASSTRAVDEAAWAEVRNFKKCLIQMWMKEGKEAVFLETALRLGDSRSHTVVDCVPVPPEGAPGEGGGRSSSSRVG